MARGRTRVVRPSSKGQITIPIEFRKALGIGEATLLSISLVEERLEIALLQVGETELLRDYNDEEVQRFLEEDKIDAATAAKVRELLSQGSL